MSKQFNVPPSKLTPMEQQVSDAGRNDKHMQVKETNVGGKKIVTLEEFTEETVTVPQVLEIKEEVRQETQEEIKVDKSQFLKKEEHKTVEEPKTIAVFENKKCPRCCWDYDKPVIEVTNEDKIEFVKSVLGNRPFSKAKFFFGEAVQVYYKTIKPKDLNIIVDIIKAEYAGNNIFDLSEKILKYKSYQVAMSVKEIIINGETVYKFDGDKTLRERYDYLYENINVTLFSLLIQGFEEAEQVHNILLSRVYDSDFWKNLFEK